MIKVQVKIIKNEFYAADTHQNEVNDILENIEEENIINIKNETVNPHNPRGSISLLTVITYQLHNKGL